jgi:hypothetical protein
MLETLAAEQAQSRFQTASREIKCAVSYSPAGPNAFAAYYAFVAVKAQKRMAIVDRKTRD